MTEEAALAEILKLKDGERWIWPESDYGRAEIWLKNRTYFLFEIPYLGGKPFFDSAYCKNAVHSLIKTVLSWT